MENVTLRQLEAFLAVAEELHFGRAAGRLSVSAPWMSHTVRDLERALRVELLSRTTRTVQVTPAGQVFAGLASQILTELSSAIKTVRNMSAVPRQTLMRQPHRAINLITVDEHDVEATVLRGRCPTHPHVISVLFSQSPERFWILGGRHAVVGGVQQL